MQPGDIVESVDMEMSDDEADGKQKGNRVLVDLRPQDRDMRPLLPPPGHHLDMDMRMIPLPSGQMPLLQGQDSHGIRQNQSQFHHNQQDFRGNQLNFRGNHMEFHQNQQPNFHQNQQIEFRHDSNVRQNQPPNFHPNQQEFYQNQQEFRQNQQQEFEYQDNQNRRRISQEFQGEPLQCGRYSGPVEHHQRDSPGFQRERGRGRGFPRNRRDRFSEDHNQQRNLQINNRRSKHPESQKSPTEILPNNRPLLLRPPETIVVLDDDGMPISIPTDNENDQKTINSQEQDQEIETPVSEANPGSERTGDEVDTQEATHDEGNQSLKTDEKEEVEILEEKQSAEGSKTEIIETENIDGVEAAKDETQDVQSREIEQPRQLSEQLEALMNSNNKQTNNNLKRQSENGNFIDQQEEGTPTKKRPLLPNGPPLSHLTGGQIIPGPHLLGPNGTLMTPGGPIEIHPVVVYEYDNSNAGFRPRGGGPQGASFPPWRGSGAPRSRGAFRGGPRAPWVDRGGRGGGQRDNFSPRGQKRGGGGGGGQFRGGFRGRGRGNNW